MSKSVENCELSVVKESSCWENIAINLIKPCLLLKKTLFPLSTQYSYEKFGFVYQQTLPIFRNVFLCVTIRIVQHGYIREYNNVLWIGREGTDFVQFSEVFIYSSLFVHEDDHWHLIIVGMSKMFRSQLLSVSSVIEI